MRRLISAESTHDRGLYHTRQEPLCSHYQRLHILGESVCSQLVNLVRFGSTCLVVAMADAGLAPGNQVQLDAPVAALHAVAADPSLTVLLKVKGSPRRMTAIEIQRHYLRMAQENAGQPWMPDWTAELCTQWRRCLDLLESGPLLSVRTFDWQMKRALFARQAERHGLSWDRFPFWNAVLERLHGAAGGLPGPQPLPLDKLIGADSPISGAVCRLTRVLRHHDLDWDELRRFLALRPEFFAIDWRFGQLGPEGIFSALDEAGLLQHRVAGESSIARAIDNPPAGSRARIRGDAVARLCRQKHGEWICQWDNIFSQRHNRRLDLSDPFTEKEHWRYATGEECSDSPFLQAL